MLQACLINSPTRLVSKEPGKCVWYVQVFFFRTTTTNEIQVTGRKRNIPRPRGIRAQKCELSNVIDGRRRSADTEKLKDSNRLWISQAEPRLSGVDYADKVPFQTFPSRCVCRSPYIRRKRKSFIFPRRPRSDERGDLTFSPTAANFSVGWEHRGKRIGPGSQGPGLQFQIRH